MGPLYLRLEFVNFYVTSFSKDSNIKIATYIYIFFFVKPKNKIIPSFPKIIPPFTLLGRKLSCVINQPAPSNLILILQQFNT